VSRDELDSFRASQTILPIFNAWLGGDVGINVMEQLRIIDEDLAAEFRLNRELRNAFQFLRERSMLSPGIEDTLMMNGTWQMPPTNKMKLSDLRRINESLVELLDVPEDLLKGLLALSKRSAMFATCFDRARAMRSQPTVVDCTRQALQELRELVRGDAVRIEELGESLEGVLQELQRSSTESSELDIISRYFSGDVGVGHTGTGSSSAIINKFNAASELVRLRQELRPFITAVRDQKLFSITVVEQLESNVSIRDALSNFLLNEAPAILRGVNAALSNLTVWEVAFVGRLSNAALLLEFLRRHGRTLETSGSLQRAQNRAAANEHASSVLLTLLPLNALLRPLYDSSHQLDSLADIKIHFASFAERFEVPREGGNRVPTAILELENLADNWSVIKFYFHDSGDGLEEILQFHELMKGDAAYYVHAAEVAKIWSNPNENQPYLKMLSQLIATALMSDDPESLLSAAIVFPILSKFLSIW
jgi:hypothetical protein